MSDENTPTTEEPAAPTKTKYIVHKANIIDDDGNKVKAGAVVALSEKNARHYNKLGFLRPYFEEGEEEKEEADAKPTRRRRTAAKS